MLATIAASFLLTVSCGQVDPITNSAAYIGPRGRMQVATYKDRGEWIQWSRPVPYYIHRITVTRKGTKIRTACDTFKNSPLTTSGEYANI